MKKQMVEDLIKFAKEQFGYEISIKESTTPDSFESIFGASFLKQECDFFMPEGKDIKLEYKNNNVKISLESSDAKGTFYLSEEIELAA